MLIEAKLISILIQLNNFEIAFYINMVRKFLLKLNILRHLKWVILENILSFSSMCSGTVCRVESSSPFWPKTVNKCTNHPSFQMLYFVNWLEKYSSNPLFSSNFKWSDHRRLPSCEYSTVY